MDSCEEDNELGSVPSPIRWILLDRWSPVHRRINCVYYDQCLDKAISGKWEGWSCCDCLIREEWKPNEEGGEPNGDNSSNLSKMQQDRVSLRGPSQRKEHRNNKNP